MEMNGKGEIRIWDQYQFSWKHLLEHTKGHHWLETDHQADIS